MIPTFFQVMQDPTLRGNAREVFLYLHERLDVRDFRVVKHAAICAELHLADSSVSAAVGTLVQQGYVERLKQGVVSAYRLRYSRETKP